MKSVDPHCIYTKATAWHWFAAWEEPGVEGLCNLVVRQALGCICYDNKWLRGTLAWLAFIPMSASFPPPALQQL